jgi:hypothetical protein
VNGIQRYRLQLGTRYAEILRCIVEGKQQKDWLINGGNRDRVAVKRTWKSDGNET